MFGLYRTTRLVHGMPFSFGAITLTYMREVWLFFSDSLFVGELSMVTEIKVVGTRSIRGRANSNVFFGHSHLVNGFAGARVCD